MSMSAIDHSKYHSSNSFACKFLFEKNKNSFEIQLERPELPIPQRPTHTFGIFADVVALEITTTFGRIAMQ